MRENCSKMGPVLKHREKSVSATELLNFAALTLILFLLTLTR